MTVPVTLIEAHVEVILPSKDGVPRDSVINTWTFNGPTANLDQHLTDFYNLTVPVWASSVGMYMAGSISRATGACQRKYYDLTGHLDGSATARPPAYVDTFTLAGTGTGSMPAECAVALSYHADYTGIPEHGPKARPRSSYRGRVFIGPWDTTAMATDSTTKRCYVSDQVKQTLAGAAARLLAAEPGWCVWSRRHAALHPVVGGWVDDAFDVQRRRGPDYVTRTPWP